MRQCRLPQARGTVQQYMLERLATLARGFQSNAQRPDDSCCPM